MNQSQDIGTTGKDAVGRSMAKVLIWRCLAFCLKFVRCLPHRVNGFCDQDTVHVHLWAALGQSRMGHGGDPAPVDLPWFLFDGLLRSGWIRSIANGFAVTDYDYVIGEVFVLSESCRCVRIRKFQERCKFKEAAFKREREKSRQSSFC